jgi:CheY-like chemotaxis protein
MARIMIVDDNREMADMLSVAVSVIGHDPIVCYSALHALKIIAEEDPDLVLLDLMMRDMDGLEFLRRVRARPDLLHLPIIVVTASSETVVADQATLAGATCCLWKPVSLDALTSTIETCLHPSPVLEASPLSRN